MESESPQPRTDGTAVSTKVIERVAALEGVDPTDLPVLVDAIDTDALDSIFAPLRGGQSTERGRIKFTYCGYEIVVHGDEAVDVVSEVASQEAGECGTASSSSP
ncbi:hypothetical protein HUG10_07340 [Halorarum halophilum]|uniref:Halobacterial output domain-containing protein n=1 Tax=Halorarum halophilum TaxID=2743090 RepID=A0A7D5GHA5_9EURY|nr:HalOD1 output domain-containing protein [Halobaculum halophilum]QLG27371.1 hypothetical protein HUG10_07340 [Halobaculum halophilum]